MKTLILNSISRSHIIFGSNTDVGKTIVSAGLVRCALLHPEVKAREKRSKPPTALVNYIKPLQSGGSDADFVQSVVAATTHPSHAELRCRTIFQWDAPASPHYASRIEGKPASDEEILTRLQSEMLLMQAKPSADSVVTYVESAGGVMSPASASPRNISANHSRSNTACNKAWGWSTQADLYSSLKLPVVLVGDSKLGGISSTLTALEALLFRGYSVDALIMIRSSSTELEEDCVNIEACREYLSRPFIKEIFSNGNAPDPETQVFSLPKIPPLPQPLHNWYDATSSQFLNVHKMLNKKRKIEAQNENLNTQQQLDQFYH